MDPTSRTAGSPLEPLGTTASATQWQLNRQAELIQACFALVSDEDPTTFLHLIVAQTIDILHADGGGICEYDVHRQRLIVMVDQGHTPSLVGQGWTLGQGPASLQGRQAVLEAILESEHVCWGLIYVDVQAKRQFTDQEAEVLQQLGQQVCLAWKAAQHVAEQRTVQAQLHRLMEGVEAIAEADALSQELSSLAEKMVALCQVTFGHILILTEDKQHLYVGATYPVSRLAAAVQPSILAGKTSALAARGQALQVVGQPVHVLRVEEPGDEAFLQILAAEIGLTQPVQSALLVPLHSHEGPVGLCILGEVRKWERRPFTPFEIKLTSSLAAQAAALIGRLQLSEQIRRRLEESESRAQQLSILNRISDYIQEARDLEKILHIVLTGITAKYGLGFNRAALFLLDARREHLEGKEGIGHLTKGLAEKDWLKGQQEGLESFDSFLYQLEHGHLPATPLQQRICRLCMPVRADAADLLSRIFTSQMPTIQIVDHLDGLPEAFLEAFAPEVPLAFVPLMARGKTIGLLAADNKFTGRSISPETQELLSTFANTAAIAIENARLFQATNKAREKLRALFEASHALVSSAPPQEVLQGIVRQTCQAAQAAWASLVLIDAAGKPHTLCNTGQGGLTDLRHVIRSRGITMEVMQTGKAVAIPNAQEQMERINPHMLEMGVRAALCLPMTLQGHQIGAMWLHYTAPQLIPDFEVEALQLFVNQAAVSYDNARRIEELDLLRQAAESMVRVAEPREVLQQIAHNATRILRGDCALIWSYDASRRVFIPEELVAENVPEPWLEKFRREDPRPGRATQQALKKGYVRVTDLRAHPPDFLGTPTRTFLEAIGVQAYQGVCLEVGGEPLGVLYVDYECARDFTLDEQRMLEHFANHAALMLKRARLLAQIQRSQEVARAVAAVSALGNLEDTLKLIAHGARDVLNCDIVTLYDFDEALQQFLHVEGVGCDDCRNLRAPKDIVPHSTLWRLIDLRQPYYSTSEAASDDLLKGGFIVAENVVAALGIQLRASSQRVGVMFVNYRRPHLFTNAEIEAALQFGNQAAVAIQNARLFDDARRQMRLLEAAATVARQATATLDVDELLEKTIPFISAALEEFYHAGVFLLEGDLAILRATSSEGGKRMLARGHSLEIGRASIVGYVTRTREPHLTPDITLDPQYRPNPDLPETKAEMAFPLVVRNQVIGVLDIQSKQVVNLRREELAALQTMADQLANAIDNAKKYEELRNTKGLVGARTALAWMGMAGTAWRHNIDGHAVTIRNAVTLMRLYLEDELEINEIKALLEGKLALIEKKAAQILDKQITPPLSSEEGVERVDLNDLIAARLQQIQESDDELYQSVEFRFVPSPQPLEVRVSPEWFRRALDILIDNGVRAMEKCACRQLTVICAEQVTRARITVRDTGPGIPPEIHRQLFRNQIPKAANEKGLGMGLLMAQVILLAYGGKIKIESSGTDGTVFQLDLPIAQ